MPGIITGGGFSKIRLAPNAANAQGEKVRLYRLKPSDRKDAGKVAAAKEAVRTEIDQKDRRLEGGLSKFDAAIKKKHYLLKEGDSLRLLARAEADQIKIDYGKGKGKASAAESGQASSAAGGAEAAEAEAPAPEPQTVLDVLNENDIQTVGRLAEFYNGADDATKDRLYPVFNLVLVHFEKDLRAIRPGEVRAIVALAGVEDDGVRNGTLNLLIDLFEGSQFRNGDYGYALKYFIDALPDEFLQRNQLLLLAIFSKLSAALETFLHSGRSVNHELEPIMDGLISVARATLRSGLNAVSKKTKELFYAQLKKFYYSEAYGKRAQTLATRNNYLLEFKAVWPIQHLVRLPSTQHRVVGFLKRVGHGIMFLKTVVGAPLKAGVKLFQQGELPDKSIVEDLKTAYAHAEKAFGFKDIPRPWYDMLERTEAAVMTVELTADGLERLYSLLGQYDEAKSLYNALLSDKKLKKVLGRDVSPFQETKQFAFGFVGQMADVAADHPDAAVRAKAVELLGRVFRETGQDKDVRVFVLTALQGVIDTENEESAPVAIALKAELLGQKPGLGSVVLFRQPKTKYPAMVFVEESSDMMDFARTKLGDAVAGTAELPSSTFIYGSRTTKIFEEEVIVGGTLRVGDAASMELSEDELARVVQAALASHKPTMEATGGQAHVRTEIGNKKEVVFRKTVRTEGDLEV